MVIVEGPDGAGKSTLVKEIAGALELQVAPRVVAKDTRSMTDLKVWVDDNLERGLRATIYDRHRLISEPIYGPVLRGRMEPGFDDWRWLTYRQQKLRSLDPMVIFCLPPLNIVREVVERDDDNKVVRDHIDTIYWLYYNMVSMWPEAAVYDWTRTTSSTAPFTIIKECELWLYKKSLRTPSSDPG